MRMAENPLLFVVAALVPLVFSSLHAQGTPPRPFEVQFLRGDPNADGDRDIADAVKVLFRLFRGAEEMPCETAGDFDDNGALEVADVVRFLFYLFLGGTPTPPGSECGLDSTDDSLTCRSYPPCEFESLRTSYGVLETVAGTGLVREKGFNSWMEAFEGGPATEAELSRPHMAMSDGEGNIYIADKDAEAVRKVRPDGTLVTVAGTNAKGNGADEPGPGTQRSLNAANGFWVRDDGTVYILDVGNGKVRRLSPDGTMETLFEDLDGIVIGRGIWVADDESLIYYASTTEVKRWTPRDGVEIHSSGYSQLGNLVVSGDGILVVTDRGANRVYRVDEDGEKDVIAGTGDAFGGGSGQPALETAFWGVRGIWFHPLGGYFLATHQGSQIWYVDSVGIAHLFLDGEDNHCHAGDGRPFDEPGCKISEARAVTMDREGNVIITENDHGFIRRVRRK